MKIEIEKEEKDFLFIHALFAITCVLVLLIPIAIGIGIKLFILVTFYNLLVPLFAFWRGHNEWINIWLFVFILSILQIWPDWIFAQHLGTIAFPDDGFFHIGPVSAYMGGLWAIPFFAIIFIGQRVQERKSLNLAYLIVSLVSFLIFAVSEGTLWMLGSWYAQNVHLLFDHIAIYILIPEIILGLTTFYFYELIKEKSHWIKFPSTFLIMLLYIGTAVSSYFFIEKILFSL